MSSARKYEPLSIYALRYLITKHSFFHPSHCEQIVEGGEQTIPDSVVALAGKTRIVHYRNLSHGKTFYLEQGRQKPVHAFEKPHIFNALTFERPISASGVADSLSRHFVSHPIRNSGRSDAHKIISLPS